MNNQTPIDRLAKTVQARRKTLGLTQAQVSQLAGVGPVFVHQLEKGKPTLQLNKILDVLHVLGLGFVIESSKLTMQVNPQLAEQLATEDPK